MPLLWIWMTEGLDTAVVVGFMNYLMAPEDVAGFHQVLLLIQTYLLIKDSVVPATRWVGAHGQGAAESTLVARTFVPPYTAFEKTSILCTVQGKFLFP